MSSYRLSGIANDVLLREGAASARNESASTALLLAHVAEIERRKLYADEGYDSMRAFCVGAWGLCEYAAYRRIGAARAAIEFPAIFDAVADGRLSLTAVNLLAPALTKENAGELLEAAAGRTKRQLRELLAEKSAEPGSAALELAENSGISCNQLAPALVVTNGASNQRGPQAPDPMASPATQSAPPHLPLHAALGQEAHDDLAYLKALLGHVVPSGNLAQVLGHVFKAAIRELERQKFAVTSRSRSTASGKGESRQVPAAVRRVVFVRDGGRCTFVSEKGHRCESQTRLQFDHVIPVAKGGTSSADNVRLLCFTHNQLEARRAFGDEFIDRKRAEARRRSERKQSAARALSAENARKEEFWRELAANLAAREQAIELVPWLRDLASASAREVAPAASAPA
jgi:5-methylcytosine-specific restriction endonuclease McrA